MAKLTTTALKAKMRELAQAGDRESYDELWHAVHVMWNLGLLDQKYKTAAIREDHRLFESGEAAPMCDGAFDLSALDALFEEG